jgi:hypothetical protein
MHQFWIRPFDEIGLIAITAEQVLQLLLANSREQRWIGYLLAIEVQNGQNYTIGDRVEKLV